MIAVLSATENDLYAYPLPVVVWSWYKLGIKSIIFVHKNVGAKIELAKLVCGDMATFYTFDCEERKEATYSQVSRLFGATVCEDENEILITGDADLAVFGSEFDYFKDGQPRIIGADLLDKSTNQIPMCFIGMKVKEWRNIFGLHDKTLQAALDETVGQLQSSTFRGDFWAYDQWYANKKIKESGVEMRTNSRAKMPERFAGRRCDRDNMYWEEDLTLNLIDAHLWRPLYTEENFEKLLKLLKFIYPNDGFDWLVEYNEQYKKLL